MNRINPHLTAIQIAFGPNYKNYDDVESSIRNTWVSAWDEGLLTPELCPTVGDLAKALLKHRLDEITF